MKLVKEIHRRPLHILGVPEGYESRAADLAIEALEDIAECDGSVIYVSWTPIRSVGTLPLLYILFDGQVPSLEAIPRVHLHPVTGRMHPAHAVCLMKMPSKTLLEGQQLKDAVRKGVEQFLRTHGVTPRSFALPKTTIPS